MDESLAADEGQYPSEDSGLMTNVDFDYSQSDINETYQSPTQQLSHACFKLFRVPLLILIDYRQMIFIALVARITTSLLHVSSLASRGILRHLILITLGIYQIDCYLRRSCPDLPYNSLRGTIYTIALTYVAYSAITNRFRTMLTKTGFQGYTVICTSSLYFMSFAPLLYNELIIRREKHGQQYCFLRVIYMSMAMKLVSLTSVLDRHKSPLSLLAYILHPASTIMGVWHPYQPEKSSPEHWLTAIQKSAKQLLEVILILLISTNISELTDYVMQVTIPYALKCVLIIYLTALDFRFSHYFTCYLASSFLDSNGIEGGKFCDIIKVEWPRSLVDVVSSWNIPMHCWLKRYVFKRVMRNSNVKLAILTTYLVSSLLHGFKFHIWSVLLTLGLFTWAEYNLRKKLAERFKACIEAKCCHYRTHRGRKVCSRGHTRTPDNSILVGLTNLIFRILTMMHLAYLGYIFFGNSDETLFIDAIERWSNLYFYGHLLGVVTLIVTISL